MVNNVNPKERKCSRPGLTGMEFKTVIFNAARDGKIRRLRVFLEHRPIDEIHKLVACKINGATPLVMASRNGHLDVVEYLLDRCSADIEQVGSVTFDGEAIEGAPPLWCASAAGHIPVVKALVKHGACVNSTTCTNSTPLRAACYDGHMDIVRYLVDHGADIEVANRHGHTCLMIACFKGHLRIAKYLMELGANVNRKSIKGNTALHDCAESGSLEIMKLLLERGATVGVDSYGMTPLMAASVTGHTHIVEFLITLSLCKREDRVTALELLGATYVDKKRDLPGAVFFWKRAMEDRYAKGKVMLPKMVRGAPIPAYGNCMEVTNLEKLEEIISDPDEMRMQALLIRERILGPAHPDTSYYIRYRGAVYADTGNFNRCITLWMYALEMQQKILEPLSPMTQSSLLSFAELFSFMMRSHRSQKVSFQNLLHVFTKAVQELENGQKQLARFPSERDATHYARTLLIVLHLVCLLCKIQSQITSAEDYELRKAVYDFVKMNPKARSNWTPLHYVCSMESTSVGRYPICSFPSAEVAELLLDCGARPDIQDEEGNTPLHIAASNRPLCKQSLAVIAILLRRGAHYDVCNHEHKNFASLLESDTSVTDIVNPASHLTLQCLAASAIRRHKLPYKNAVPMRLVPFIELH